MLTLVSDVAPLYVSYTLHRYGVCHHQDFHAENFFSTKADGKMTRFTTEIHRKHRLLSLLHEYTTVDQFYNSNLLSRSMIYFWSS